MKTNIGGDRLGSGNKKEVSLKNYERSTHNLGYIWRSSMASGTLVPFMSEVALPGDNFDIKLDCDVLTLPTIAPLFGSYKVQLDLFQCPIRLYQANLHMNALGIGLNMNKIKLPQIRLSHQLQEDEEFHDNCQIGASSIFSYLNIRGLGRPDTREATVERDFNAVPYLGYWDIYKNYYANKQEERGMVIHNDFNAQDRAPEPLSAKLYGSDEPFAIGNNGTLIGDILNTSQPHSWDTYQYYKLVYTYEGNIDVDNLSIEDTTFEQGGNIYLMTEIFENHFTATRPNVVVFDSYNGEFGSTQVTVIADRIPYKNQGKNNVKITEFPLDNIDQMREDILKTTMPTFLITESSISPYGLPIGKKGIGSFQGYPMTSTQEGLGLKTYQSDLFNNWIQTEWLDGTNGINEVTSVKVDEATNTFNIDSLNLANKVYNMLNRIALSGGTYDDWLDAVYTHDRQRSVESPMYLGSLIKELTFQEVVSTGNPTEVAENKPLGTLAGRGKLTNKHKGGYIKVRVDEPSYIMGIVSITPRIDYSQGNKWDVNLKTMDDFHKPALDEIGFQDLITDQMAWADTLWDEGAFKLEYSSAGKQPAWLNYMTNVNVVRGHFAEQNKGMFMTLNRRYDISEENGIEDLTTYIDPTKFNHIFAQTEIDAQNFWVQIGNNIIARRKMSAKLIPNL